MSDPTAVTRFHVQISLCSQNLRLVDAEIQRAIVHAEQAGDFAEVARLSAYEAEVRARKIDAADTSDPSDDAILTAATAALIQLNKKMKTIVASNESAAHLIGDLGDLLTNGANLWQAANKKM